MPEYWWGFHKGSSRCLSISTHRYLGGIKKTARSLSINMSLDDKRGLKKKSMVTRRTNR